MTGRTHITIGALSSILLINLTEYQFVYLLMAGLGGLFPDIDAKEATIHNLGFKIGRTKIEPFRAITVVTSQIFKHRGWLHSILGAFVVTISIGMIVAIWFRNVTGFVLISFLLGYLSHLIADSTTRSGVPLWYPFSKKNIHLLPKSLRLSTGKGGEVFIEIFTILLLCMFLFWLLFSGYLEYKF